MKGLPSNLVKQALQRYRNHEEQISSIFNFYQASFYQIFSESKIFDNIKPLIFENTRNGKIHCPNENWKESSKRMIGQHIR